MYKKIVQGVSLHGHIPVMSDRGLILTQDSLYLATYDLDLDKVTEAVNIPLASITQLLKGGVSLNRVKNLYGVVILY